MWPLSDNIDQLWANISRDIATFANPGTDIERATEKSSTITLKWEAGRTKASARFRLTADRLVSVTFGGQEMSYASFLASEQLADLMLLAQRTYALLPPTQPYVPARAILRGDEEDRRDQVEEIVRETCGEPLLSGPRVLDATRLLFVRGPAGSGKTVAMRMIAREQAARYLECGNGPLFLYVDAQGRALSRLNEALAFELQTLGAAAIRYNAVSTLVRNRLLVPIIDGFDELIGSGGFADAFGSLSAFLSELERQGTVVATGRSTFYDDQRLSLVAERFSRGDSLNYYLQTLELEPWGEDERRQYLEGAFPDDQKRVKVDRSFSDYFSTAETRNRELLGKAFFVVQLARLIGEGEFSPDQTQDLMAQLITHLLDREVRKLLDRQGLPVLDSEGHRLLLRELATEMWWQETRTVDSETLDTIGELAADELRLRPENRNILLGRIRSHALLTGDREGGTEKRGFEHEMYYDYFLLDSLLAFLDEEKGALGAFLARSALGEALLEQLERLAIRWDPAGIRRRCVSVSRAVASAPKGGLAKRNGGAVAACMIRGRRDLGAGLELSGLEFYGSDLSETELVSPQMKGCYFREARFFDTCLVNPILDGCVFDRIHLDPAGTRLNGARLQPGREVLSLVLPTGESVYDPARLGRLLQEMGVPPVKVLPVLSDEQHAVVDLVKRFATRAARVLFFDPDSDDINFKPIVKHPVWDRLWRILRAHGLIDARRRDRSGPRAYLYKLAVPPDELLAGLSGQEERVDSRIAAFWRDLLEL